MTMTEIGAAYDGRAAEYINLFGTIDKLAERDHRTITAWRDGTTGRLLDAGCGPGHWSVELTAGGVRDVVGLDASAQFVTAARERFRVTDLLAPHGFALGQASARQDPGARRRHGDLIAKLAD